MIFKSPDWQTRHKIMTAWHKKFVIFPVQVDPEHKVALGFVERQQYQERAGLMHLRIMPKWAWRYRRAGSADEGYPPPQTQEKAPPPPAPKASAPVTPSEAVIFSLERAIAVLQTHAVSIQDHVAHQNLLALKVQLSKQQKESE